LELFPDAAIKGALHLAVPEHEVHYLEIVTADAEAARSFYSQAYGWSFEDMAPELGNAFVAALPNGSLCGIRAPMHEQEMPTVRTYIRVDDISATIQRATELGAVVALEPMEIPGRGTIAIHLSGGVEQGIWQLPS
jgi:predicted enzyme related to lactoylglutathione lyase